MKQYYHIKYKTLAFLAKNAETLSIKVGILPKFTHSMYFACNLFVSIY